MEVAGSFVCFFAGDLALLASSQRGFQQSHVRVSTGSHQAGMKISTKKGEVLCSSGIHSQCNQYTLQVSGNKPQQVERFKYLGVAFASDGGRNKKIDSRNGKANAILRESYRSVSTKQELSNTANCQISNRSLF